MSHYTSTFTEPSGYSLPNISSQSIYKPYYDFISVSLITKSFDKSHLNKNGNGFILSGEYTNAYLYYNDYDKLTLRCSIPWYIQGHNLSCDPSTLEIGVLEISNKIGLDLRLAGVNEMELSKLFILDCPVNTFQDKLIDLKGFERVKKSNTLYYNKYKRGKEKYNHVLKFYNAVSNAHDKKMTLQFPRDRNVLKYEEHLYSPSKHFDQTITLKDLITDESISKKLYSEMEQYYNLIEKRPQPKFLNNPSAKEIAAAVLLTSVNDPSSAIDYVLNNSFLKPSEKYQRRQTLKKYLNQVSINDNSTNLIF